MTGKVAQSLLDSLFLFFKFKLLINFLSEDVHIEDLTFIVDFVYIEIP